nr:MAG TPA: hypothetical protein [Caudoviricetes sp.]
MTAPRPGWARIYGVFVKNALFKEEIPNPPEVIRGVQQPGQVFSLKSLCSVLSSNIMRLSPSPPPPFLQDKYQPNLSHRHL